MKTKFLIIVFLIVSLLGAFSLKTYSQFGARKEGSHIPVIDKKEVAWEYCDSSLIADETTLTYSKTGAKIITSSEDIFQKISLKWGEEFKSINIRYKKDRHGRYKEYAIYISESTGNNILQWAKKNL